MMKNKILALYLGFLPLLATAQNPIIQTKYTADPAPMVHNDTLFLYVGCDEKDAPSNAYLMREYRLYTTTDMVNWTDCGAPLKTSDFKWSAGDASAAQCIEGWQVLLVYILTKQIQSGFIHRCSRCRYSLWSLQRCIGPGISNQRHDYSRQTLLG